MEQDFEVPNIGIEIAKLKAENARLAGHTLALQMIAEARFHDDKTVEALAWCQDLARTMLK